MMAHLCVICQDANYLLVFRMAESVSSSARVEDDTKLVGAGKNEEISLETKENGEIPV